MLQIGVAAQKQVIGLNELVNVAVSSFRPVCRRMIRPLIVGMGINVIAVKQRVVV